MAMRAKPEKVRYVLVLRIEDAFTKRNMENQRAQFKVFGSKGQSWLNCGSTELKQLNKAGLYSYAPACPEIGQEEGLHITLELATNPEYTWTVVSRYPVIAEMAFTYLKDVAAAQRKFNRAGVLTTLIPLVQ